MDKYQSRRIALLWTPLIVIGFVIQVVAVRTPVMVNGLSLLAAGFLITGALMISKEGKS